MAKNKENLNREDLNKVQGGCKFFKQDKLDVDLNPPKYNIKNPILEVRPITDDEESNIKFPTSTQR